MIIFKNIFYLKIYLNNIFFYFLKFIIQKYKKIILNKKINSNILETNDQPLSETTSKIRSQHE
jgi:hypothetical protein